VAGIADMNGDNTLANELSDIIKFTPQWWKSLGNLICNMIIERARSGKGVKGKFHSYTENYREIKGRGFMRLDGNRMKAYRGVSITSSSTNPDMTVTGKMLHDLRVRSVEKNAVNIGWMGIHAQKIRGLFDNGYDVINLNGDPLDKREENKIVELMEKKIDENINKWESKPVNIVI